VTYGPAGPSPAAEGGPPRRRDDLGRRGIALMVAGAVL